MQREIAVRLLLDSNVLLWFVGNRPSLTRKVLELLNDDRNELFLSIASFWELAIKVAKGKLSLPDNSVASLHRQVERLGITVLPIIPGHILRTETLPHHHRDPFDRMIIAQAMEERLTILSADEEFPKYNVPVIW